MGGGEDMQDMVGTVVALIVSSAQAKLKGSLLGRVKVELQKMVVLASLGAATFSAVAEGVATAAEFKESTLNKSDKQLVAELSEKVEARYEELRIAVREHIDEAFALVKSALNEAGDEGEDDDDD